MKQEHFGKVAKCRHGKIGVIYGSHYGLVGEPADRLTYYGISLDGSRWQSVDPEILADNLNEFLSDRDGY